MRKKVTVITLLLWPILAFIISFSLKINAFSSTIVFYLIPSLILSLQKPKVVKKSLIVSSFIVPFAIIIDYIAEATRIWQWPLPTSIIPLRIFGTSIEIILWAFLHMFVVIMFYQYFFEKHVSAKKLWSKKSKEALLGTIAISIVFFAMFVFFRDLLLIPYWYFVFGTIFILPGVILEDLRFPLIFPRLLKTGIYFAFLNFSYEIAALKIGWWSFPSEQFIGRVYFFGVNFPFEEMFFWIILFTIALLSYYEYFFNGER